MLYMFGRRPSSPIKNKLDPLVLSCIEVAHIFHFFSAHRRRIDEQTQKKNLSNRVVFQIKTEHYNNRQIINKNLLIFHNIINIKYFSFLTIGEQFLANLY